MKGHSLLERARAWFEHRNEAAKLDREQKTARNAILELRSVIWK